MGRTGVDPTESDGALYDAYVETLLAGSAIAPEAFLADHPDAGADLRARVRELYSAHLIASTETANSGDVPYESLGDFRLLRSIGTGGMGALYEARQRGLGRLVALKLVRPEIRSSPTARARFEREAAVLARLTHPHVVGVHAFGEDQGVCYLAMELVPGRGLDELAREASDAGQPLVAADVVRWGAQIARALAAAHAAGIVHRDVKPSNIRITPDGDAVLLDFGVARDAEVDGLTLTGPLVGSPLYAAPEQISGRGEIDARTDVYGLGATLYECIGGRPVVERGTVEQVIHRKMHTDPQRLRSLRDRVGRDLDVVVMKCVERDPERRYASASTLADDLDAVLALQPISARPPSMLMRVRAWARRRPAVAAAAAAVALAVVVVSVGIVATLRAQAAERRRDAAALVDDARSQVTALGEARLATVALERDVRELQAQLEARHQSDEEIERLDRLEMEVTRLRRERQDSVHAVVELLRRAERLDPDVSGTAAVRASLHLERFYQARVEGQHEAELFHRRMALEADPDGDAARHLERVSYLDVTTDPPGADVYAFRLTTIRELPGRSAPRQVPVSVNRLEDPNAGRIGLRAVRGTAQFPAETLVIAVDGEPVTMRTHTRLRRLAERGGVSARVLDGAWERTVTLPPGGAYRPTGAPLLIDADDSLGVTPIRDAASRPGAHILLIRKAGFEDARVFLADATGVRRAIEVSLLPVATTPDGFVRVHSFGGGAPPPFWMMEREVIAAEYLRFLNDPTTLEAIDGGARRFVPRGVGDESGYWSREPNGTFRLPDRWRSDWPVIGVSFDDVQDYIRWLAEQDPPPSGYEYGLPTQIEWLRAAAVGGGRSYVYGDTYRPHWCCSCFSRERADVEPVMGYPIDESPYGVYDMAGSVSEWGVGWWDEARGLLRVHGGSWAQARPEVFKSDGGFGQAPSAASGETGFRLVLRRTGESR